MKPTPTPATPPAPEQPLSEANLGTCHTTNPPTYTRPEQPTDDLCLECGEPKALHHMGGQEHTFQPPEPSAPSWPPAKTLFNHMYDEHGLVLLESELIEIANICTAVACDALAKRVRELEKQLQAPHFMDRKYFAERAELQADLARAEADRRRAEEELAEARNLSDIVAPKAGSFAKACESGRQLVHQLTTSRSETEAEKRLADQMATALKEAFLEARTFDADTDQLCDNIIAPTLRDYRAARQPSPAPKEKKQ